MNVFKIAGMLAVFVGLLVLWPNLVHEPLHYAALRMQGLEGHINFHWALPAHPSTTKEGQIASIGGGLLFLLLPSIVSVLIIAVLFMTKPNLWTHFVLSIYLVFDLIINIRGYAAATSDFRFLQVLPHSIYVLLLIPICAAGLWSVWRAVPALNKIVERA